MQTKSTVPNSYVTDSQHTSFWDYIITITTDQHKDHTDLHNWYYQPYMHVNIPVQVQNDVTLNTIKYEYIHKTMEGRA